MDSPPELLFLISQYAFSYNANTIRAQQTVLLRRRQSLGTETLLTTQTPENGCSPFASPAFQESDLDKANAPLQVCWQEIA